MPGRGAGRLALGAFFALFVAFLYGPTLTILVLSFQGPEGGLTFPMRGVSTEWFSRLFARQAVGDLGAAFGRSLALAALVTAVTVAVSVAAGLAFRKPFRGSGALFTLTLSSLIVPAVLVSLGIGLMFSIHPVTAADQVGWLRLVGGLRVHVLASAATALESSSTSTASGSKSSPTHSFISAWPSCAGSARASRNSP